MRVLWTLLKIGLAAVFVIPAAIIVLVLGLGILGALFGLAVLTIKIAAAGLILWFVFRLLFGARRTTDVPAQPREIAAGPRSDPYYDAAMRELDRDLGVAK